MRLAYAVARAQEMERAIRGALDAAAAAGPALIFETTLIASLFCDDEDCGCSTFIVEISVGAGRVPLPLACPGCGGALLTTYVAPEETAPEVDRRALSMRPVGAR